MNGLRCPGPPGARPQLGALDHVWGSQCPYGEAACRVWGRSRLPSLGLGSGREHFCNRAGCLGSGPVTNLEGLAVACGGLAPSAAFPVSSPASSWSPGPFPGDVSPGCSQCSAPRDVCCPFPDTPPQGSRTPPLWPPTAPPERGAGQHLKTQVTTSEARGEPKARAPAREHSSSPRHSRLCDCSRA